MALAGPWLGGLTLVLLVTPPGPFGSGFPGAGAGAGGRRLRVTLWLLVLVGNPLPIRIARVIELLRVLHQLVADVHGHIVVPIFPDLV